MALSSPLAASSQMASLGLRPPQFSEDVAWLPGWFQNLRTGGSNESPKKLHTHTKDLAISQEKVSDGKDINALSREEAGYNSCHLFLSGEDNSPISFSSSPGNVFHFSLRLSSDVDSLFSPNQGLHESHNLVDSSKLLSIQPVKTSVDFGENIHFMMGNRSCEQKLLPSSITKMGKKDDPKSATGKIDFVRQEKEKSEVTSFKNADISNAVELSIAASEALVIHELVKMGSVSERLPTEAVLEVALRVKQARVEGLEDRFHSSNEESDWSDSLSDLNDFTMADAYEDVGLPSGVSNGECPCSSAMSQAKDIYGAEKCNGCDNKLSNRELIPQPVNLDGNSAKKHLEVNVEMERQPKKDSPVQSLFCGREKHSDDPGLGHFSHQFVQNTSNICALSQAVGLADLASNRLQNSVNSSLVGNSGNFKDENLANYLVVDRFKSRWLGGWTSEELDSSPGNQNNAEQIPKFFVRETSFLSESADIVPDQSSFVQKHNSKSGIGSQPSIPSESLQKSDEGILHSEDMVRCSNLSLDDPLCSVVPCSISSEQANSKTQSHPEIDTDINVPAIPEFKVANFQRTSDQNFTLDHSNEQIMSLPESEDIPITVTNMDQKMPEMLTSVNQTCQKQLSSLKTYSMIMPNQSLIQKCNRDPTDQRMGVVAPLHRSSKSLSASKSTDGDKIEQNNEQCDNHKSNIEIAYEKRSNDFKAADGSVNPVESTEERRSTLILNDRRHHSLLCPETDGNGINVEKHPKQHVLPESSVQHQQNNNLNKLQADCNEFNDGHVRVKKQVRFSEAEEQLHQKRTLSKLESSYKKCSSVKAKRQKASKSLTNYVPHMKHSLTNYCRKVRTKFILQGTEFLLTGLSSQKERDMEALIRNSGGVVLTDIPSPPNLRRKRSSTLYRLQLPIILCMRKLQTTKFLYGCAVGALVLKVDWLTDCIASGTILQPEKYMILPNRNDMKLTIIGRPVQHSNQKPIFERVGIMLHGAHNFCTKLASIIKHGGGQVFKTLQWLVRSIDEERISVGAIIAEDKPSISRHLKYCALERGIPIMPSSWIIKSLYSGKLLPFSEENRTSLFSTANVPEAPDTMDMSQEI